MDFDDLIAALFDDPTFWVLAPVGLILLLLGIEVGHYVIAGTWLG